MSIRNSLYSTVVKTIKEYGIDITVYRDVYENEVGVKVLVDTIAVGTFKAVIDNSKSGGSSQDRYSTGNLIVPRKSAQVYIAWDEESAKIQYGDYIYLDGLRYTLSIPQNLVHYNLLIQLDAEVYLDE